MFVINLLYAIIHQRTELQFFSFIYGFQASGKSVLINLASALVGESSTITTTLKAFNNDQFQVMNFLRKKLVVITDTSEYIKNLDVLKAYTGGNKMRQRAMFTQGTVEIKPEGIIIAVGNSPLTTRDAGNSVLRRMKPFKTEIVHSGKDLLIGSIKGKLAGSLVKELPGIFNKIVNNFDQKDLIKYIVNQQQNVTSLQTTFQEASANINPLRKWVSDSIEVHQKSEYIGNAGKHNKSHNVMFDKRALYATYFRNCQWRGISPLSVSNFTIGLPEACRSVNIHTETVRMLKQLLIKYIRCKPEVYTLDYQIIIPRLDIEGGITEVPNVDSVVNQSIKSSTLIENPVDENSSENHEKSKNSTDLRGSINCGFIHETLF